MERKWKIIKIRIGHELKTSHQLSLLGIKHEIPITEVKINGIIHSSLKYNGIIKAYINKKEEDQAKRLPYITAIEKTKNKHD